MSNFVSKNPYLKTTHHRGSFLRFCQGM